MIAKSGTGNTAWNGLVATSRTMNGRTRTELIIAGVRRFRAGAR